MAPSLCKEQVHQAIFKRVNQLRLAPSVTSFNYSIIKLRITLQKVKSVSHHHFTLLNPYQATFAHKQDNNKNLQNYHYSYVKTSKIEETN